MKRVQAALRAALDDAFRSLDLSVSQYAILEAVVDVPESEATNAAIARRCFITPQSASELVAGMIAGGLVARTSAGAGRRIRLTLTPLGRTVRATARERSASVEQRMLSGQTRKDRERLAASLARCAESLERTP